MLADRIKAFLVRAQAINTQVELLSMLVDFEVDPTPDYLIQDACEEEVAWVYATYRGTTPHAYITKYRNAIALAGLSPGFLYYFRERPAEVTLRQQTHDQDVQDRQEHQYPLSPARADALVERATQLLTSGRYADVVIALALLTGRRPYEVAVLTRFRQHRSPAMRKHQYLYCRGRAKTGESERARTVLEIPVLGEPSLIVRASARLRALHNFYEFHPRYFPTGIAGASEAFMQSCGARFREQCAKHFAPLVPDAKEYLKGGINPQKIRKFYEAMVAAWWEHTGMADPRFIMEILGHYDLRHANEYLDVCFSEQVAWRFQAKHVIQKRG